LTNKSNLTDRLYYDLVRFFEHLVVAYFLGHPVYERHYSILMYKTAVYTLVNGVITHQNSKYVSMSNITFLIFAVFDV